MLQPSPDGRGYVIDVEVFHKALRDSMNDYLRELCEPVNKELRNNLWTKMDQICNVRRKRGAVYVVEAEA